MVTGFNYSYKTHNTFRDLDGYVIELTSEKNHAAILLDNLINDFILFTRLCGTNTFDFVIYNADYQLFTVNSF